MSSPIRRGDYVVAPPFNEIVPRWIRRDWGIVVDLLDEPPPRSPTQTWLLVSFDSSRLPMKFRPSEVTTIEYERMVIPNHGCG